MAETRVSWKLQTKNYTVLPSTYFSSSMFFSTNKTGLLLLVPIAFAAIGMDDLDPMIVAT
jgi:hypothetical protein